MKSVKNLDKPTVEKSQYDLVKGDFSPVEASEITNHLFNKKINFHQCRNFGQIIRTGESDSNSEQRIDDLRSCQESIIAIIKDAESQGKSVRLKSEITIELI